MVNFQFDMQLVLFLSAVTAGIVEYILAVPNLVISEKWKSFLRRSLGVLVSAIILWYTNSELGILWIVVHAIAVGFGCALTCCGAEKFERFCRKE